MEIRLTDDQRAFIQEALDSGRIRREEDAVQQAMLLWEERERRRLEILATVDRSEASLARGEGRTVTSRDEATQLADDVKQRALAKLSVPQDTH